MDRARFAILVSVEHLDLSIHEAGRSRTVAVLVIDYPRMTHPSFYDYRCLIYLCTIMRRFYLCLCPLHRYPICLTHSD